MIRLPTDPALLNLTEEQILWIFEKYKEEFPEHFKDHYIDPDYEEWERQTLEELGEPIPPQDYMEDDDDFLESF